MHAIVWTGYDTFTKLKELTTFAQPLGLIVWRILSLRASDSMSTGNTANSRKTFVWKYAIHCPFSIDYCHNLKTITPILNTIPLDLTLQDSLHFRDQSDILRSPCKILPFPPMSFFRVVPDALPLSVALTDSASWSCNLGAHIASVSQYCKI